MLRLKKLRRQRDPTSTSATKCVAQRTSEGHRRSVGTLDERSRPTAGRRRIGGECVRCTRKATSEEPDTRTNPNTGGSGAAAADLEARAELELRHAGARSTSEPGLSRVHPHWGRESTGCQDAGAVGASHRAQSHRGAARTVDGVGARARRGARTEDAGRHHGGGNEYSLSDRQQFIRRWSARAHANHAEGREGCGWIEEADSEPDAQCEQEGDRDRTGRAAEGAGGRRTARRAVSGTGEFNAKDCASSGRRVAGNAASSSAPASAPETITGDPGNDGRTCATGGAANQGASVSRDYPVSAQDRESFRAAHGNHSQRQGEQAKRVREHG